MVQHASLLKQLGAKHASGACFAVLHDLTFGTQALLMMQLEGSSKEKFGTSFHCCASSARDV